MLGVGWTEMLIIGVVALIVIGPKDLPAMMHRIGKFAGTIRRMGADFQRELNKTTGLDEVKNLRTAITQPLKATTDAIRKEFNTTTSTGAVQPSGLLKPADPKVESVVSEIHKAAGMTPPQTPAEAMKDAVTKATAATPVKTVLPLTPAAAAAQRAAEAAAAAPQPPAKPAPRKRAAKKVESPAPIEAIAPAKKPAAKVPAAKTPAKLAAKPMPKALVAAPAKSPAKPKAKAAPKAAAEPAPKPAAKRKPTTKKA
jgi:sec-independent protein translocase protein TatB